MSPAEILETLVQSGRAGSERVLTQDPSASLAPMILAYAADSMQVLPFGRGLDVAGKHDLAELMPGVLKKLGANAYALIVEAWMSRTCGWDGVPSESPDRVEVVHILARHRDGTVRSDLRRIVRGESGNFVKFTDMPGDTTEHFGLLSNLFLHPSEHPKMKPAEATK